jgi:hypothetical protein
VLPEYHNRISTQETSTMLRQISILLLAVACQFAVATEAAAKISTADHVAITHHIAHYGHTFDRGDSEGFANLFHPNGSWHAYPNKSPTALQVLNGREEIAAFANDRQQMFKDVGIETKHFMLNIILTEVGKGRIKATAMALILWQRPYDGDPLPRPVQSGYYDFYLSKSAEGWRFDRVDVLTSGVYRPIEMYREEDLKKSRSRE